MEEMEMSRTRIVAFLLIAMVYGSGLFAQNAGLMRAVFQINNGDYRSAYDELTQISPASSEASYYYEALGKAAFLTGKYAEAIQAFEQRTKLPQPGIAFLELAKVYFMQEDFDSGYEFLAKHLQSPSKLPYNNIISDRAFENLDRDRRWIRFWSENWYTTLDDQIAELNSLMLSDFPVLEPLEKLVSDHEDDDEVLILAAQYYNKLND